MNLPTRSWSRNPNRFHPENIMNLRWRDAREIITFPNDSAPLMTGRTVTPDSILDSFGLPPSRINVSRGGLRNQIAGASGWLAVVFAAANIKTHPRNKFRNEPRIGDGEIAECSTAD